MCKQSYSLPWLPKPVNFKIKPKLIDRNSLSLSYSSSVANPEVCVNTLWFPTVCSLPYNIKCLQAIVVVIWRCIIELNSCFLIISFIFQTVSGALILLTEVTAKPTKIQPRVHEGWHHSKWFSTKQNIHPIQHK